MTCRGSPRSRPRWPRSSRPYSKFPPAIGCCSATRASRLFRPGAERHDRRLTIAVGALLLAAVSWKIGTIGWEGLAGWGRTTGARVVQTTLGMEWTTAAGLGAFARMGRASAS